MDIKKINSAKARRSFSDLLNETGFGGHRTVITRKGKAVAAMVPLDDLKVIEALEDKVDVREAEKILDDPDTTYRNWEQVKKEL